MPLEKMGKGTLTNITSQPIERVQFCTVLNTRRTDLSWVLYSRSQCPTLPLATLGSSTLRTMFPKPKDAAVRSRLRYREI